MKQRIPTAGEYRAFWEPLHSRLFSGAPMEDGPFADPTWTVVLLPGDLLLDRQDFESLRMTGAVFGDEEFIVVDGEGTFADEPPVLQPWDFEHFRALTLYGQCVAHSFGRSGKWARASHPETFNLVGGSQSFMSQFIELSGGTPVLYERFMQSVDDGDVSFGEQGEALVRQLLQLVGWDKIP